MNNTFLVERVSGSAILGQNIKSQGRLVKQS